MKTSIECPMSWTHCRETRAHGARTRTPEDKPISQGTPDEPSQEAVAEAFKHSLIEYRSWRPCEVARPAAPVGLYWLRQIPKGGKPVVGLGLDALSLSGSLRVDADFLMVGLGEDPLRLQLARRAVLLGDFGPLGPHAFEDMLAVQFRQVQAADVDADHIDTIGRSGQVCDAANDFRRHGLIVALCWVGGDENGRRKPSHNGADLRHDDVGETLLARSRGRDRGEKAYRVGDPPRHEAIDAEVLLVDRQILGRRRPKEQDALVQPHNAVERRNDVEARLG